RRQGFDPGERCGEHRCPHAWAGRQPSGCKGDRALGHAGNGVPHYIRQTPDAFVDDATQVGQVIIDNPAVDDGAGRDEDVVDVAEALKHLPYRPLIGDICRHRTYLTQLALRLRQLVLRTASDGDLSASLP